jgi:hypothetical protein
VIAADPAHWNVAADALIRAVVHDGLEPDHPAVRTVLEMLAPVAEAELAYGEAVHAISSQLQWIVDAYMLVFGGLLLVAGSLADRVGRKRTFLAGLAAFAGGSAWAAFSGSVGVLIAARASMGVGAALMMPSTLAIITDMFRDARQRQLAIGLWAGTSGLGFALGPIVGGLLLARFWWGSVFLINVPIAAVGLLCALPLVPDSKNPAARPDLAGAVLSIAGLGLVLWAIIEAPVHGWSSVLVIGTGIAGLAVLAGFAAWERASSHPMLNLGPDDRRAGPLSPAARNREHHPRLHRRRPRRRGPGRRCHRPPARPRRPLRVHQRRGSRAPRRGRGRPGRLRAGFADPAGQAPRRRRRPQASNLTVVTTTRRSSMPNGHTSPPHVHGKLGAPARRGRAPAALRG